MLASPVFVPFVSSFDAYCNTIHNLNMEDDLQEEARVFFEAFKGTLKPSYSACTSTVEKLWLDTDGITTAIIDGVRFHGRVLENLKPDTVVFPYSATSGNALEKIDLEQYGFMAEFFRETIKREALSVALQAGLDFYQAKSGIPHLYSINPGSGSDGRWDVSDLHPLYDVLHAQTETEACVTESSCMLPNKTIAGIWFSSEKKYSNCGSCPRKRCPERQTPFMGG
ncbi:MAG: hypothetical protein WC117_07570 [Sphaerochaetaceae bacterium]